MSVKIIHNRSNFDVQTIKLLVKSITGGKGGLCYGLDIDQNEWVNSSTDKIIISPGGYVFDGEAVEIHEPIVISNIFQNTRDGDSLFFYHRNDRGNNNFIQLGYGNLAKYTGNIVLAVRKNGRWNRLGNICTNLNVIPKDFFVVSIDNEKNTMILDVREGASFDDEFFFDGTINWSGLKV